MKKILLLLAALICLQAMAWAVPDSVTTGLYNISFDLGLPKNVYTTTVFDPKSSESLGGDESTTYIIKIENSSTEDQFVIISIGEYAKEIISASTSASSMEKTMQETFPNADEIASRKIDSKNGAIAKILGEPGTLYVAIYCPNTHVLATIMASYPWDEGTLSLLKTIHIEKTNATA